MKKGLFITFEGIDFSGKSVQARYLFERLQRDGQSVILIRDPGTTRISEQVRAILLNREHIEMSPWTELLLYEAARAQMVHETIQPALAKKQIVICDRFYDSTTAYQGYGRELDLCLVKKANQIGSLGFVPDMTFILNLQPEVAARRKRNARVQEDRLEAENTRFHHRVAEGYRQIALAEPNRIIVIDGDRGIDVVHTEIVKVVNARLAMR